VLQEKKLYRAINNIKKRRFAETTSYKKTMTNPTQKTNFSISQVCEEEAKGKSANQLVMSFRFDSNSKKVGVDNRASLCISNDIDDFEGPIQKISSTIKGIGGKVSIDGIGTIIWHIMDDDGQVHTIKIPNSFFI